MSRGAAVKITVIFADSQSDCSQNMPPSNMRYIAASFTNQIADILCIDGNSPNLNRVYQALALISENKVYHLHGIEDVLKRMTFQHYLLPTPP